MSMEGIAVVSDEDVEVALKAAQTIIPAATTWPAGVEGKTAIVASRYYAGQHPTGKYGSRSDSLIKDASVRLKTP